MGYEGGQVPVPAHVGESLVDTKVFFDGLERELQQYILTNVPQEELLQQAQSIQYQLQELKRRIEEEERSFYTARLQVEERYDAERTNRPLHDLVEDLITEHWARIHPMREAHADLLDVYAPLHSEWVRRREAQSALLRTPEHVAREARARVVLEMRHYAVPAGESLRAQFVPKGTGEIVRRWPWWLLWGARDEVKIVLPKERVVLLDEAVTAHEHENNTFFSQFIRLVVFKAVTRGGGEWERFLVSMEGQLYLARAELVWSHDVGHEPQYNQPVRVYEHGGTEVERGRSWLVPSIQQIMVQAQSMYADMAEGILDTLEKEIPFEPQIIQGEYIDVLPHNRITSLLSGRVRGDHALALRRRAFVERMRDEIKKGMPEDVLPDAHPARA